MRTAVKEKKFDAWRHGLLDLTRRNRLINYHKSKRSTLRIMTPEPGELYKQLVTDGQRLSFRRQINVGDDPHLTQLFYLMDRINAPVELAEGDIASDLSTIEMSLTLKNLRMKARLSLEEQGINILYLTFGFLYWKQKPSDPYILSPLVLVPASLEIASVISPYYLRKFDEDIVVNPTLDYVLSSDYGIRLPEFDAAAESVDAYLDRVGELVSPNGWCVKKEASLGLMSFLKIMMYKDLEKYKDRIFANPVVRAFCGDPRALPPIGAGMENRDHDQTLAIENCQVVNADASQQDAITLSRNGISFVLQGPPGTGKSQTITNIIAQALADKKKVLFVSEKMAALSVVYRRLSEVGLADYCLSLHNHKAERRAVLQDLVSTLDAPVRNIKPGVTAALNELEKERSELNAYIRELNMPRQPLNKTVYEVLTALSEQQNGDFYRITGDVTNVTEAEFGERLLLLGKVSDFLAHDGGRVYVNPWRGTGVTLITYDIRHTVTARLSELSGYLFGVSSALSYLSRTCGTDRTWTISEYRQLIRATADGLVFNETAARILSEIGQDAFASSCSCGLRSARERLFSARDTALREGISAGSLNSPAQSQPELNIYRDRLGRLEACRKLIGDFNALTGAGLSEDGYGLEHGRALLDVINMAYAVPARWFTSDRADSLLSAVEALRALAGKAAALREAIDAGWEEGFYLIDYKKMLGRFSEQYIFLFTHLGSQYRSDKASLTSVRRGHPARIDDKDCIDGLILLRDYHEALDAFQGAVKDADKRLAPYYHGIGTDWDGLKAILSACADAQSRFDRYGLSDSFPAFLEKPREERLAKLAQALGVSDFSAAAAAFDAGLSLCTDRSVSLTQQILTAKRRIALLNEYTSAFDACGDLAVPYLSDNYRAVINTEGMLALFDRLIAMTDAGAAASDRVTACLSAFGLPSDEAFIKELADLFDDRLDPGALTRQAQSLADAFLGLRAEAFADGIAGPASIPPDEGDGLLETFDSWFPQADCFSMPVGELSEWVQKCADVEALQSWLTFSALTRTCDGHDLTDYIRYVKESTPAVDRIVPVYSKSFLTKWLIDILARDNVLCLQSFQAYAHEKTVADFKANDRGQLKIAQARLLDFLSHEKPAGISQLAGAMDEVTVLRREAEKKRRITPLRKLFRTIPTLLTRLKPCFMMSPLSVSYFLDSEMYDFDLVIFDEASQILPEDAIGAIYRGRQVIIAGDTKQMPPTTFFSAASRNTDEYDTDEDDDAFYPDIVSESILDEAVTCLPVCTLLWHYRSRDESLIAFSNQRLYGNSLITFPNCSRLEDRGLEYIYIPDGVYEGSGRNCNAAEARKCLELTVDHIARHPERSLGIIAFSEKQQTVIEEVISDYRVSHPEHEDFFDESRDEPFFVKNLENVQGDERDTIIFSICYAKNAQGRMYQRFGPLSHDGGERRLNVAITRAKYNVKLVGSILPTDIAVRDDTKEGVRMLKDYIYYAMQNDTGIPAGAPEEESDRFADQIADFITANGFACRRNVGASRYRVDVAVGMPGQSDTLTAGIECDGPHYASARTARDRDVLRRDIMASLGWRMYHVWSMAWYLNHEDEKRRLIGFLRKCAVTEIGEAVDPFSDIPPDEDQDRIPADTSSLTSVEDKEDSRALTFAPYEYADPMKAPYEYGDDSYGNLSRRILFILEKEQPIHREELCRRLAPVFGNQKVTNVIRKTVDDCLAHRLKNDIVRRGDFLYLPGRPVIPRGPSKTGETRPIGMISPEEIREAMCVILACALGLTQRDLIGETARQLGFTRTGPKTNAVLEECCRDAVLAGVIREADGRLTRVKEDTP